HGWIALTSISCGLFILSFWASTLVANTIRAALTAVIGLVPLYFCAMAGTWCAKQTGGLGVGGSFEISEFAGVFGFVGIVGSIALIQSLSQFRRIRLRASTVFTHSLILGAGVVLGSFLWTSALLAAAK